MEHTFYAQELVDALRRASENRTTERDRQVLMFADIVMRDITEGMKRVQLEVREI